MLGIRFGVSETYVPPVGVTGLFLDKYFKNIYNRIQAADLTEFDLQHMKVDYASYSAETVLMPIQEQLSELTSTYPVLSLRVTGGGDDFKEDDESVPLNPERVRSKPTAFALLRLLMSEVADLVVPMVEDVEKTRQSLVSATVQSQTMMEKMLQLFTFQQLMVAVPTVEVGDTQKRQEARLKMAWVFTMMGRLQPTHEFHPQSIRTLFSETLDDLLYFKSHVPKPRWIPKNVWDAQFVVATEGDTGRFIQFVGARWNEDLDDPAKCVKKTRAVFDWSRLSSDALVRAENESKKTSPGLSLYFGLLNTGLKDAEMATNSVYFGGSQYMYRGLSAIERQRLKDAKEDSNQVRARQKEARRTQAAKLMTEELSENESHAFRHDAEIANDLENHPFGLLTGMQKIMRLAKLGLPQAKDLYPLAVQGATVAIGAAAGVGLGLVFDFNTVAPVWAMVNTMAMKVVVNSNMTSVVNLMKCLMGWLWAFIRSWNTDVARERVERARIIEMRDGGTVEYTFRIAFPDAHAGTSDAVPTGWNPSKTFLENVTAFIKDVFGRYKTIGFVALSTFIVRALYTWIVGENTPPDTYLYKYYESFRVWTTGNQPSYSEQVAFNTIPGLASAYVSSNPIVAVPVVLSTGPIAYAVTAKTGTSVVDASAFIARKLFRLYRRLGGRDDARLRIQE